MKRIFYWLLISLSAWGPGCVEVMGAERYRNEEIFDLDIGGKLHRKEACGKNCGVCGKGTNGCNYEGENLGCKYVFCKHAVSPGGHQWTYERRFNAKAAQTQRR